MMTSIGVTCSKFTRISLEREIRIGAVSYLNTKPLLYGLSNASFPYQLSLDYPANLVKSLQNDQIDIGLIPVAALLQLPNYQLVTDYCIGAVGEVASVCLYSNVPLNEVKKIKLDYQSRTSVMLCKLLMEEFFKKEIAYVATKDDQDLLDFEEDTASLLIGDRALRLNGKTKYKIDLAATWIEMTGLPFVFAVWVSKQQLSSVFVDAFNKAVGEGVHNLDKVIEGMDNQGLDLDTYYKKNISYLFDEKKQQGMRLFLEKIKQLV
jgi:chorismate dehydratase